MHLAPEMWTGTDMVSAGDNLALMAPFSLAKITANLKAMRVNTAPGLDGFPVTFYLKFWAKVGPQIARLVANFTRGRIDFKRLNYGGAYAASEGERSR